MSWTNFESIRLENDVVSLRPLTRDDREGFRQIAFDPEIWRFFIFRIDSEAALDRFVEDSVGDITAGRRAALTIVDRASGTTAGSMSFGNLAPAELRLEIGWSWLGRRFQGSTINGWSKYLMLQHAFETLTCERVEFKTDVLNTRARHGLLKIGAQEEGVLRSYNFMPDGRRRDAIYYSILKREWPTVKTALFEKLRGRFPGPV